MVDGVEGYEKPTAIATVRDGNLTSLKPCRIRCTKGRKAEEELPPLSPHWWVCPTAWPLNISERLACIRNYYRWVYQSSEWHWWWLASKWPVYLLTRGIGKELPWDTQYHVVAKKKYCESILTGRHGLTGLGQGCFDVFCILGQVRHVHIRSIHQRVRDG